MLLVVNVDAVEDRITEFGAGAKLYWYRDNTSSTGTFVSATGSTTLVLGQTQYEIVDATGAPGHWYRTRVGNTGGTTFDEYGTVFQAGAVTTYATIDALQERLGLPTTGQYNLLSDILEGVTSHITTRCGRDFFKHPPVSGTETRTYTLRANESYIPDDIISIASGTYRTGTGVTPTALTATDWYLSPNTPLPGWPYEELIVSDAGLVSTFYRGYGTVSLTGVFGWAAIPADIREATLDLAQERYYQIHGGRQVGLEFGRVPPLVEQAIEAYRKRSFILV